MNSLSENERVVHWIKENVLRVNFKSLDIGSKLPHFSGLSSPFTVNIPNCGEEKGMDNFQINVMV